MKNTTKKILSMVLAVIMILSVMPVACAERATFSPEAELYIESFKKASSYSESLYETSEQKEEVQAIFDDAWDRVCEACDNDPIAVARLGSSEDIIALTEIFQNFVDTVEDKIKSGELVIVINFYKYYETQLDLAFYYEYNEWMNLEQVIRDYNPQYWNEISVAENQLSSVVENEGTQAEFDAAADKCVHLFNLFYNCLDGIHNYGEYISNGDATEETDGTKTATCELCGATDTVIDEGSKLDSNDNSKCSCNCHKSGIMGLIWKILNFFHKIFGMNKTCSCGVAHY